MTNRKIDATASENESCRQFYSNKFYEVKFESVSFWSHFPHAWAVIGSSLLAVSKKLTKAQKPDQS